MTNNAEHSSESLSDPKGSSADRHRPRYWLYLPVAVVVIAALLFLGWLPRHSINKKVQARANQAKNALPIVQVVTAEEALRRKNSLCRGPWYLFRQHMYMPVPAAT
jgi:hypothetical protein